jgi:CRP/FNR family transcriptional activator FtrB
MTRTPISRDLLRSISLFAKISEDHLASLTAAAAFRAVPARTDLFREGAPVKNLKILLRGAVELFSECDERHFTTAVVLDARPLAVSSILANWYPMSARFLEPSELILVPADLVVSLMGSDAGLASAVAAELAYESVQIFEEFKSHRLLTTTERIADWILRRDGMSGGTGKLIIPFDKRVLASYLGMAPEQLSRHFAMLASVGVSVQGRNITLVDRRALEEIAGTGNRLIRHPHHGAA